MRKHMFAALVFFSLCGAFLFAEDRDFTVISRRIERFENADCKRTQSCGLKSVQYVVEDYKIGVGDAYAYGTRFYALYEATSVRELEDYVFVQFIKGCQYAATQKDGRVELDFGRETVHFGKQQPIRFADWVVDTESHNPVLSSGKGSRFRYLFWSKDDADPFLRENVKLYMKRKPKVPRAYITDRPGVALVQDATTQNISMKFRTCMYRASDIPDTIPKDTATFVEPLSCFEWDSSFVYDYEKRAFENLSDIAAACTP